MAVVRQCAYLPNFALREGKYLFIRRDPSTGDLILSSKPNNWDDFFLALKDTEIPKDFLSPKDRKQGIQTRDPLDGVNE